MLLSESSLEDLNSKLEKKVTVANFRPNFYVKGCEKPYAEVTITFFNLIQKHILFINIISGWMGEF